MTTKGSERLANEVELGTTGPIYVRIKVPSLTKWALVGLVLGLSAASSIAVAYRHASFNADFWVEALGFLLPILAAGFAGYGVAHAAEQSRLRLLAEEKKLHRAMIQRTFDALTKLDESGGGTAARIKIRILMTSGIEAGRVDVDDAKSVQDFLMADHPEHELKPGELRRLVGETLGRFEEFALAVRYGHIHERLAYDSMALVVNNFHHWFGLWMASEEHKNGAYCEALALARAWKDERSLVTGEALPRQGEAVRMARDAHSAQTSGSRCAPA